MKEKIKCLVGSVAVGMGVKYVGHPLYKIPGHSLNNLIIYNVNHLFTYLKFHQNGLPIEVINIKSAAKYHTE